MPNGFTAPTTGSLALNFQGQSPVNCIFAANGKDFTCSNMPVGNTAGDFPIQSQVNGSTPTNTGEVVSVEEMPPDPEIIITEINWAGSSASTKDQWVEFRNTGTTPTDLTQVIIVGIGTDAAPAIRINSDTSFSTGTYQNGVFTAINNSAGTCLTTTIPASGYFLISAYNKNNAKTTLNIQPDCYFTNENLIDINKNGETLTIYKNTTTTVLDQVGF